MKEKLEFLLRTKSLTATSLARLLEIQPSGISHILSGRNKPSFDFVVKVLRVFPDINPDWLLLDDDRVYRDETDSSRFSPTTSLDGGDVLQDSPSVGAQNIESATTSVDLKNEQPRIFSDAISNGKTVERIIILYSDKSFESYGK